MPATHAPITWLLTQHERMVDLVTGWANINSGTHNLPGLAAMASALRESFSSLGAEITEQPLPPTEAIDNTGQIQPVPLGKAMLMRKRPEAPLRVFLGIHRDTVYGPEHPFQKVDRQGANTLRGPGVADAKGGLAVMLLALQAVERSEFAKNIGWEILINPDEEIGSPGSSPLFVQAASRNHLGLLFEPAFFDGALVGARKGSGNFAVVIHGRAAHAGRDISNGRNALQAAAGFAVALLEWSRTLPTISTNVGRIDGGGPVNIVPDLAVLRFNVRITTPIEQHLAEEQLAKLVAGINARDGYSATLHGGFLSPPKPLDERSLELFEYVAGCGHSLEIPITWRPTGGVCDGNKLAAAGLPVVDTLGPVGGNLHSPEEYVRLDSLVPRAQLTALLLLRLASGEISLNSNKVMPND